MKKLPFDFTTPVSDHSGNMVFRANAEDKTLKNAAVMSDFALLALGNMYEGEALSPEAKWYRADLEKAIRAKPSEVMLSFRDRALLIELLNRVVQSPLVYEKLCCFLEAE